MIAKGQIGKRVSNEAEIAEKIRAGLSVKQIALEESVGLMTVRRIGVRLGLRPKFKPIRKQPLERSDLHKLKYVGPKVRQSTLPLEAARQCSDDTIERWKFGKETKESREEIYRIASQFHVGKEPSLPELAIPLVNCVARRGAGMSGLESAS